VRQRDPDEAGDDTVTGRAGYEEPP